MKPSSERVRSASKGAAKRGQAAVEFALAGTVLIAILFGVLEVGRLVYVRAEVENSAREGAQYAALHLSDGSNLTTNVNKAVLSKLIVTDHSSVTVNGPCFPDGGDPNYSCPTIGKCPYCRVQVGVASVWRSYVSFIPSVSFVYTSTKLIETEP